MLIETPITNPVRPYYTARVFICEDRRKENVDIPFPDRRAVVTSDEQREQ